MAYTRGFATLRSLGNLTLDEYHAWSIIFARALGHLNGRRLVGIYVPKKTNKTCVKCDRKARVVLVFRYGDSFYQEYYCLSCFDELLGYLLGHIVVSAVKLTEKMGMFGVWGEV